MSACLYSGRRHGPLPQGSFGLPSNSARSSPSSAPAQAARSNPCGDARAKGSRFLSPGRFRDANVRVWTFGLTFVVEASIGRQCSWWCRPSSGAATRRLVAHRKPFRRCAELVGARHRLPGLTERPAGQLLRPCPLKHLPHLIGAIPPGIVHHSTHAHRTHGQGSTARRNTNIHAAALPKTDTISRCSAQFCARSSFWAHTAPNAAHMREYGGRRTCRPRCRREPAREAKGCEVV